MTGSGSRDCVSFTTRTSPLVRGRARPHPLSGRRRGRMLRTRRLTRYRRFGSGTTGAPGSAEVAIRWVAREGVRVFGNLAQAVIFRFGQIPRLITIAGSPRERRCGEPQDSAFPPAHRHFPGWWMWKDTESPSWTMRAEEDGLVQHR